MMIPDNELKQIEASLNLWRTPNEFAQIIYALHDRVPSHKVWGPKLKFLREGVNAADFSRTLGCEHVRLVKEAPQRPDFEIRSGGMVKGYQLTEALEVDRKRNDEDWESNVIELDPAAAWAVRAAMVPGQLRKAVKNKLGKYPPNSCSLAVYLNIGTYGLRQKEIEADFHDATALSKDEFTEVWVFWGLNYYLLWQEGKHSSRVVRSQIDFDNLAGSSFAALFG